MLLREVQSTDRFARTGVQDARLVVLILQPHQQIVAIADVALVELRTQGKRERRGGGLAEYAVPFGLARIFL